MAPGVPNPSDRAYARERLRQQKEVSNQALAFEAKHGHLRLAMGYAALLLLILILLFAMFVILNHASFPPSVVASANRSVFAGILGLLILVWKAVLKPSSHTAGMHRRMPTGRTPARSVGGHGRRNDRELEAADDIQNAKAAPHR